MTPIALVLERITSATGRDPKRAGAGWASRCPAHDDHDPSLSISEGRDRNVLLKCHAGCDLDAIVASIGLTVTDLFLPKETSGTLGEVVASYVYTDADGTPMLRVNRFHPKTFRQQHAANGAWVNGAGNTPKLLYRLPDVRAEAERGGTVWIAEGEKDVHALEAAGLVATCNAGGAGKFNSDHAAQLDGVGLAVVVVDNDATGRDHARKVGLELSLANIPYKLVMAAEGKDAADHLAAGHGVDEFVTVAHLGEEEVLPDADEWADPIPLGAQARELPLFPTHTLPEWMAAQVANVATDLQMPVDLPAVLGLVALATVAAGRVDVNVAGVWKEPLNIYCAVAMPPSAGKSPAFAQMLGPVRAYEARLLADKADALPQHEQNRRMLEKQMTKAENAGDTEEARRYLLELLELGNPVLPRLVADDATPEALTKLLADHDGRMAILSTEGGLFDLMTGRYSEKANLDVYLKAWGGDTIIVDRIGRGPAKIDRPALTIGLTVQPHVIAALADKPELAGRGLTARIMYAMPPDNVGERDYLTDRTFDHGVAAHYDSELTAVINTIDGTAARLTLQDDAHRAFKHWKQLLEYDRKPEGPLRPLAEWSTKLESTTIRVAGLLHLADRRPLHEAIDLATMNRAIEIGDYWLAHAFAVHDLWGTDPVLHKARKVLEWIGDQQSFTVRDCYGSSSLRRLFNRAEAVIEPLGLLIERGWLRPTEEWPPKIGRRGKESPTLIVHPKIGAHARHVNHVNATQDRNDPESGPHARHVNHVHRDKTELSLTHSQKMQEDTEMRTHGSHGAHESVLAPTGTDNQSSDDCSDLF